MTVTTDAPLIAQSWGWRHSGRKQWAVRDANFTIRPGEKVLLAGASGSGKSTLLAGIAGLLDPEEGTGEGELGTLPGTDLRSLVGMVQQDPDSQVVMAHVGEEIAFGCENWGVPATQIPTRVEEALALVGLDLPLDHPTSKLSGGQKQRLALASALAMRPQILLLDEPTANLDPEGAQMVRESVARIAQVGVTLIVIEHRIEPWLPLVDKMLVMDSGSIVAEGPPEVVLAEQSDRLLAAGVWVPGAPSPSPQPLVQDGHAIVVRDLSVGYSTPIQEGLNLDIARGISTCITGANGTGKTTLALTLAGLLPPLSGKVELEGHNPHEWSSAELADHVGMVFQEPSYQFLTSSVRAELELSAPDQPALVDDYLDRLGLSHLAAAHPLTLSGGEKRRLAAATALIRAPKVLILDEPTFGQDRNTWLALVQIVQEAAASGTTVVSISHDPDFVAATAQANIELELAPKNVGAHEPQQTHEPRQTQELRQTHELRQTQDREQENRTPAASVAETPGKTSILDRVNPVTQILGLALMTVPLMFTIDWVSAAVALALELSLCVILFGSESKRVLRRCWPIFIGAPLAVFSMLLYAAEGGTVYWSWGPASISANSVALSLGMGLRVLAVGIPAVVILGSLDATKTADALTQIARLPARPVLATLAAARLVSLMLADWDALTRARRIRGVPERSRVATFFVTTFALFSFALRRAGLLSTTMEARGFGSDTVRSQARTSTLSKADAVMLLVSIAVPACALGTAVAMGTFRWFGL